MGFSYGPSTKWAIAALGSVGASAYVGASVSRIILFDVQNQISFPGWIGGAVVGAGVKLGGTISDGSPTFFTVSKPLYASDFDNSLCALVDASFGFGPSASGTGLTIYGIDHHPSVLNLSGFGAGFAGGISGSPLQYMWIRDQQAWQNNGCQITPDGDPLCGGSSTDSSSSTESTTDN